MADHKRNKQVQYFKNVNKLQNDCNPRLLLEVESKQLKNLKFQITIQRVSQKCCY